MSAWQIKDWGRKKGRHRLFAVSQSSRYEIPSWVPWPINLNGDHYAVLMSDAEGQRAYGIFAALVALAAVMPCKGLLADVDGALSARSVAAKIRVPLKDYESAVRLLSAPEIGWLQPVSVRVARQRVKKSISEIDARSRRDGAPKSVPEQETEQETAAEQEPEKDKEQQQGKPQPGSSSSGVRSAAAAMPPPADWADVGRLLASVWPNGHKAGELISLPGATPERVAWLIWRSRTDKPPVRRRQGFIEKGIREGWPVDEAWLVKWRKQIDDLNRGGQAA